MLNLLFKTKEIFLISLSIITAGTSSSILSDDLYSDDVINDSKNCKRARVLYDYDAKDVTELSLMAEEIISVQELPNDMGQDYYLGIRGQQTGKVPKAFVDKIL